jgi:hypothetical protein
MSFFLMLAALLIIWLPKPPAADPLMEPAHG